MWSANHESFEEIFSFEKKAFYHLIGNLWQKEPLNLQSKQAAKCNTLCYYLYRTIKQMNGGSAEWQNI